MTTYRYTLEGDMPLGKSDLFRLFNNYRVYKYIIELLVDLDITDLSNYRILEPGCGDGNKLRFFTELRAKPENCYGLEISSNSVDLCKSLSPNKMQFIQGSALDMPFEDEFFDIVLCSGLFGCFNNENDIRVISSELSRVLKKSGILFVLDLNENFNSIYSGNAHVMAKGFNTFDSKGGELEALLEEFTVISIIPAFACEHYGRFDRTPAQVIDLPRIDASIDAGERLCGYTLWTFFKKLE